MTRVLRSLTYGLTSLVGLGAFLYPFWLPEVPQQANSASAHANDSALMMTLLVGLCFVVLLLEVQQDTVGAKTIALLGVLVAINATLRFLETAIPGPGGFSPVFLLIVLGGYVFGGGFGFLLGALTLLVSALVTGGVGPWLPYQMVAAGWVGLTAPLCRPVAAFLERIAVHHAARAELWTLAVFSAYWGLLYGAIMNLWFWPFAVGPAQMHWTPGVGAWETVQRYVVFYVVTSLAWDLARAVGNLLLVAVAGAAILRILRRFQRRFAFVYTPAVASREERAKVAWTSR
ncbi:MAG: ECF transporter S component [Caldilinea sp.]|nr:ECF transporter S component [Caldilinea sp.]MDW8440584.1 ECF transporter S component [Caldilineaceae bacterium]